MKKTWIDELKTFTTDIFLHPELGYEEWRTAEKTKEKIQQLYPSVTFTDFARTGFSFTMPHFEEKKWKLCFVAELDAVYLPSHFQANPKTGAAHVCGH